MYSLLRTLVLSRMIVAARRDHDQEHPDGPQTGLTTDDLDAARRAIEPRVMERDTALRAALCMLRDSSGFAHNLGKLYTSADGDNQRRLLGAFPDVFAEFAKRADEDTAAARMASHRTRV